MATLTETAYYSRKIIKWSIIGFVVFIFIRLIFIYIVDVIKNVLPPPPLRPNNYFGKLYKLNFPEVASPSGQLKFTLQTIEGKIPVASSAARVYFMPKNRVNLLSLSKAQTFVGKLGFTSTPHLIKDTVYRWIDTKNPLRLIELDTVSNHFTLEYAYAHDLTLFTERNVPTREQTMGEVINFLQTSNLGISDLNIAKPTFTYLKLEGDQLVVTTSQSQADAVRVDLFRNNLNGFRVLTDRPNEGLIEIILGSSKKSDKRILYARNNYWPIDIKTVGIYKLKTSTEAWEELQSSQGYFASYTPNQTQFTITNISLALYDSRESQFFLQPVFVFEGENKFLAYVSAVAMPWTE